MNEHSLKDFLRSFREAVFTVSMEAHMEPVVLLFFLNICLFQVLTLQYLFLLLRKDSLQL